MSLLCCPRIAESTPIGRLVQRFSKDLDQIDQQLPNSFGNAIWSSVSIIGAVAAITLVTPSSALVLAPIFAIYFSVTNYYRSIARELKRLESISRSPIYAQFSETLGGLSVIRAFARQRMFQQSNEVKLDDNIAAFFSLKAVDRWLSVRLEILGNLIVFSSALLATASTYKAGAAGISLNSALGITSLLNWAVRNGAEVESLMNSVERVLYTTTKTPLELATVVHAVAPEALVEAPTELLYPQSAPSPPSLAPAAAAGSSGADANADANTDDVIASTASPRVVSDRDLVESGWPWRGGITLRNVAMRYRPELDPVLRGVDLEIRPGESIGIVGRTGSGKSSLFRALLRLNEVEAGGSILLDGVDVSAVGLDALRSGISIIPQDPILFSGTVR